MKSYTKTKRIATIFMALILTLMMGSMAAFAADTNNDGYDDATGQPINSGNVPSVTNGAHVSKIVQYNQGDEFDLTFEFEATPTQVIMTQRYDGVNTETVMTQPASACPAVTINDINVVVDGNTTYQSGGVRVPKANMSDAELAANTQGVITFGSGASTGAAAFPHAGVFAYNITESENATTGLDGNAVDTDCLTYDNRVYLMRVYVVNGQNGLEIQGITFQNPTTGAKVDRSEVLFTNTYIETADNLEVMKVVTGAGGDQTKQFSFTVTFSAPSVVETMPDGTTWNPTAISGVKNDAGSTSVSVNSSGVATFTLAHGEKVTFDNLPVGATYTVQETGLAGLGYTPTGQAVQNGETRTAHVGSHDTNFTSDSAFVGDNTNSYTITNTADTITPTGLVINNLPIILLAVLAIGGFVAYRAMRRRIMSR